MSSHTPRNKRHFTHKENLKIKYLIKIVGYFHDMLRVNRRNNWVNVL